MATSTANLAEAARAKAAAMKGKTNARGSVSSVRAVEKKPKAKAKAHKPRKQGEGKYDRNRRQTCPDCKKSIAGPWSFKMHLIKVHGYSPDKAGLTVRTSRKVETRDGKTITLKAAPKES